MTLPPTGGRVSYQIGGPFAVPQGVSIVDRDHAEAPDATVYSICYVNAYQAQPEEVTWWTRNHPDLLLRDAAGQLVIDKRWQEPLFDISSPGRRAELLQTVGSWIDGCSARGYGAVEADNLDSYTRSKGHLTVFHALTFAHMLAERAHSNNLAFGQKNGADLAAKAKETGFDFAVAEECQVFSECDAYTSAYGRELIEIEYTDQPTSAFQNACDKRGTTASIVLRDRNVTPSGSPHHVERWCG